jgi:hypothetical protein
MAAQGVDLKGDALTMRGRGLDKVERGLTPGILDSLLKDV